MPESNRRRAVVGMKEAGERFRAYIVERLRAEGGGVSLLRELEATAVVAREFKRATAHLPRLAKVKRRRAGG